MARGRARKTLIKPDSVGYERNPRPSALVRVRSQKYVVTLFAQSLSLTVAAQLRAGPQSGRVLTVSARACNLLAGDEVVALVTPDVGDGPLNVVVAGEAGLFAALEPGAAAALTAEGIAVGSLRVGLAGAVVWEPRPDWPALRARHATIAQRLPLLRAALRAAPAGSLLALLDPSMGALPAAIERVGRRALAALQAGWAGDMARLREGAAALAGLGGGLTPAGDDFLCGWMLGAWLAHPHPEALCRAVVEESAGRTTALAAALLRAAARGECGAAWHGLFDALGARHAVPLADIERAAAAVLAHGATSGADGLAGMLAACQCVWGETGSLIVTAH